MAEKKEEIKKVVKEKFHFPAQGKVKAVSIEAASMEEAVKEYEKLNK